MACKVIGTMNFGDCDGIGAGDDDVSSSPSSGDSVCCKQTPSVGTYHKTCTGSLCGGT